MSKESAREKLLKAMPEYWTNRTFGQNCSIFAAVTTRAFLFKKWASKIEIAQNLCFSSKTYVVAIENWYQKFF